MRDPLNWSLYVCVIDGIWLSEPSVIVYSLCVKTPLQLGNNESIHPICERKPCIYKYINKDGNPSTTSTRHVKANVNTREENQSNQNSSNEVEDLMLKWHPLPQIKSGSDGSWWWRCISWYVWKRWRTMTKLGIPLKNRNGLCTLEDYRHSLLIIQYKHWYKHWRHQGGLLMVSYIGMYTWSQKSIKTRMETTIILYPCFDSFLTICGFHILFIAMLNCVCDMILQVFFFQYLLRLILETSSRLVGENWLCVL
jgi:hypothetical protein